MTNTPKKYCKVTTHANGMKSYEWYPKMKCVPDRDREELFAKFFTDPYSLGKLTSKERIFIAHLDTLFVWDQFRYIARLPNGLFLGTMTDSTGPRVVLMKVVKKARIKEDIDQIKQELLDTAETLRDKDMYYVEKTYCVHVKPDGTVNTIILSNNRVKQ